MSLGRRGGELRGVAVDVAATRTTVVDEHDAEIAGYEAKQGGCLVLYGLVEEIFA